MRCGKPQYIMKPNAGFYSITATTLHHVYCFYVQGHVEILKHLCVHWMNKMHIYTCIQALNQKKCLWCVDHKKHILSSNTHKGSYELLKPKTYPQALCSHLYTTCTYPNSEQLHLRMRPRRSLFEIWEMWEWITITVSHSHHAIWYSLSTCVN